MLDKGGGVEMRIYEQLHKMEMLIFNICFEMFTLFTSATFE